LPRLIDELTRQLVKTVRVKATKPPGDCQGGFLFSCDETAADKCDCGASAGRIVCQPVFGISSINGVHSHMAKKNASARKPGGAASIETVENELDDDARDIHHEMNGSRSEPVESGAKAKRGAKPKAEQTADGNFGVGDVKKAAAFVNSIGGLEKAIAVLQILKVAKEIQ
jgi:hypothetical protein